MIFPLKINNSIIKKAIRHFQVNIENVIKYTDNVYCYYSRFIDLLKLKSIPNNNAILMAVFKIYILHYYNLDICNCYSKSINLCHDY